MQTSSSMVSSLLIAARLDGFRDAGLSVMGAFHRKWGNIEEKSCSTDNIVS